MNTFNCLHCNGTGFLNMQGEPSNLFDYYKNIEQLKTGAMKYCDCCHIDEIDEKDVPIYEDKFYWYAPFIGVYIISPGNFVELKTSHEMVDDYGSHYRNFSSDRYPEKQTRLGKHIEINEGESKIGLIGAGHYCKGYNFHNPKYAFNPNGLVNRYRMTNKEFMDYLKGCGF